MMMMMMIDDVLFVGLVGDIVDFDNNTCNYYTMPTHLLSFIDAYFPIEMPQTFTASIPSISTNR